MSVKIMQLVWENAPYQGGSLLVFLALADWSNDEGISWPSVPSLATKARIERRQAQRIIRQLKDDQMIEIVEGGRRHQSHTFKINIPLLKEQPELSGASYCRPSNKGDISDRQGRHLERQGRHLEHETVTPMTPDPLEPPLTTTTIKSDPPAANVGQPKVDKDTRIPEPFILTKEMKAWAAQKAPNVDVVTETQEFVDFWRTMPGRRGVRRAWPLVWQNRMREMQRRATSRNGNGRTTQSKADLSVQAGMELIAELEAKIDRDRTETSNT